MTAAGMTRGDWFFVAVVAVVFVFGVVVPALRTRPDDGETPVQARARRPPG